MIIFDIETKLQNLKQTPFMVGFVFQRQLFIYKHEYCIKKFIKFIFENWRVKSAYAHNFANFDSYFILKQIKKMQIEIIKVYIKNNNIIYLHCVIGNREIIFRDSFLYFGKSLNYIMHMYGWKKQFSHEMLANEMTVYLAYDVISLSYFLHTSSVWSVFNYRVSIASCISIAQFSYRIFRKCFFGKLVIYIDKDLRVLFQPFFGGNKIQITTNFIKNGYHYDINSLYPYTMLKLLPNFFKGAYLTYPLNIFFGFAIITCTEKPRNGLLDNYYEQLMFSEEIKILLKLGYKFKYHLFFQFSAEKMFTPFIEHFYSLKRYNHLRFLKFFSKICLNSLYGKMATKISKFNSLHVAMAINSYGRIEMISFKQSYFIYADTDSIVIIQSLASKYINKEIGGVKLLADIKYGFFIPNYYLIQTKTRLTMKAKGMIKKVFPVLKDFKFKFKLSRFFKQEKAFSLKEIIHRFEYSIKNQDFLQIKYKIKKDWINFIF